MKDGKIDVLDLLFLNHGIGLVMDCESNHFSIPCASVDARVAYCVFPVACEKMRKNDIAQGAGHHALSTILGLDEDMQIDSAHNEYCSDTRSVICVYKIEGVFCLIN